MSGHPLAAALARGLDELDCAVDGAAQARLLQFLDELLRWNRRINLTAIREPVAALSAHLLDSLSVLPHLPAGPLLDVGSGGGLPGLVLAIARPELPVHSVEATAKKAAFQNQLRAQLGLANVTVTNQRVEDVALASLAPQIISRAFTSLREFALLAGPLLAPGGVLLAMKGQRPDAEIAALPEAWEVLTMPRLRVPGLDAQRHLVILQRRQEKEA